MKKSSIIKSFVAMLVLIALAQGLFIGDAHMKVNAEEWNVNSSSWVVTDALGRTTPSANEIQKTQKDRFVGIFYHNWHHDFMNGTVNADRKAPRNVSQIIRENDDALNNSRVWGPNISYHYWGEPLFGFYDLSVDEYVIRKHAQMLTDAGIDTIILDYSNYATSGVHSEAGYMRSSLKNILDTFVKIRSEGGDTPGVVFLLTWNGEYNGPAVKRFYNDFYSKDEYKDLWFNWEGKPLILAQNTTVPDEIKDFFTYRKPHPLYTPVTEPNAWPWLSIYPQEPAYTATDDCEMVAVGVAQNWTDSLDFMSAQDENGNFIARGRSYTVGGNNVLTNNPISPEYKSEYGANLQQQFDRAIELDPEMILITGWNEWIAARFLEIPSWAASSKKEVPPFGGFCDVFSTEFSRDAEPTREGGLGDNFYNQLVINIRRFKGNTAPAQTVPSKQVDVNGSFDQWSDVTYEYRDDINDISIRDAHSIGKRVTYTNNTGRNDFRAAKVTYDNSNIYFYVETVQNITPHTDSDWMNLLLQVSSSNPNWEGFDFVVNRTNVRDGLTTLEKSNGGYNWSVVSEDIQYTVNENKMMLCIPKTLLGFGEKDAVQFNFKWTDNTQAEAEGDALAFYLNGDCAPNERFCYRFSQVGEKTENKKGSSISMPLVFGIIGVAALLIAEVVAIIVSKKRKGKKA